MEEAGVKVDGWGFNIGIRIVRATSLLIVFACCASITATEQTVISHTALTGENWDDMFDNDPCVNDRSAAPTA